MTHDAPTHPDAVLDKVVTALRRDDLERAERALAAAPGVVAPEAFLRLAELNVRRRRWRDAAWLFDRVPEREPAAELKRCLARNMAALQRHRPAAYAALADLPPQDRVQIRASATGRPTIVCREADGALLGLSPGNDPLAAMRSTMSRLKSHIDRGDPVGLCGMGDGYLLHAIARDTTNRFLGMQQPVFVLEPDPQVALHCLMIHDYTGPDGPIEQERFRWFVGPSWAEHLSRLTDEDPHFGLPAVTLSQGPAGGQMLERVRAAEREIAGTDLMTKERVKQHYNGRTAGEFADLFGPNAPRPPRVLLLTTRFSTVLQYSTRDTADAFRRLGWEARVLIEPSPAHRLYQHAMRRAVEEFKPDLVFQIDHLRYEHGEMFPPGLPFVCWIQDHLPHLKTPRSAASVTENDFVLTDAAPVYAATFGYPRRQLIGLGKLTRVADLDSISSPGGTGILACGETDIPVCSPSAGENQEGQECPAAGEGTDKNVYATTGKNACATLIAGSVDPVHDLVFVSNASHLADELLAAKAASHVAPGDGRRLLAEAGRRLIAVYRDGGCVATWFDLLTLVRTVRQEARFTVPDAELESLAGWLFHPLNDALYRQQTLTWAAVAADDLGLSFGLYGKGWERHPALGRFARGSVAYGPELEQLTRRSRINLQVVPYLCLHQRLLDGLTAGGFYLIRAHPADTAAGRLLDFLREHVGPEYRDLPHVRSGVPAEHRDALETLVADCLPAVATSDRDDPIDVLRSWEEMGLVLHGRPVLPRFAETSFADAATLRTQIERFIADPAARAGAQREQRASVIERFTYEEGMRRVIGHIRRLLAETARRGGSTTQSVQSGRAAA